MGQRSGAGHRAAVACLNPIARPEQNCPPSGSATRVCAGSRFVLQLAKVLPYCG
jgi:hypothetical protein